MSAVVVSAIMSFRLRFLDIWTSIRLASSWRWFFQTHAIGIRTSPLQGNLGFPSIDIQHRNRNLKTSKALLKSRAHQGTSLFTSAATNERGFSKGGSREAQVQFPESDLWDMAAPWLSR